MKDFVFCSAEADKPSESFKFTENIEGVDEWPYSWPDGEISYRLNNHSLDFAEHHQLRAVTVALRAWQIRISKLKFRRERNKDVHVDFQIAFQPLDKFRSKGILAHAWFPNQGDISGDVEINDDWNWVSGVHLNDLAHPPLVPILIHEFGHSLGLRHDITTTDSILYPSFNLGRDKNNLHTNDVTRIQSRYGVRNLPHRWILYFQNRRAQGWDYR